MASSVCLFFFFFFFFFFSLLLFLPCTTMAYNYSHHCHSNELSALMQLRQRFLSYSSSAPSSTYPSDNLASWKLHQDCCSWDGVECDEETGHVIGLDLSNSSLYGSFHPNSTLFALVHLQSLNLAYNDFNYSKIPSGFGRLSMLVYLNLSHSMFSGQVPYEISSLTKLASLDFSSNPELELKNPSLGGLVGNMSRLQQLHLSQVQVTSQVPPILANMSHLTSLWLESCQLQGEFPSGMFQLPNLRSLSLKFNSDLRGNLPDDISSPLEILRLAETSFSGELPASIGDKASSLYKLDLQSCRFSGRVPSSLGNLTRLTLLYLGNNMFHEQFSTTSLTNLTQLQSLMLSQSDYEGENLNWVTKLTNLSFLNLDGGNFCGQIPSSFGNLTKLFVVNLNNNQLTGEIPSCFANLTKLAYLGLSFNQFTCKIPTSLMKLTQLTDLYLDGNKLVGTVPFQISNLTQLSSLGMSSNNLHGSIPSTIFQLKNLMYLDISSNNFSGNIEFGSFFPLKKLVCLYISHNSFAGDIPPSMCNLTSLKVLDLSFNNLSGPFPRSFNNLGESLSVLNLQNNNLEGIIPRTWPKTCRLKMINLSNNRLEGGLPASLVNCGLLESIDVSDNMLRGSFPSWLGSLSKLKILILRSNHFDGTISTNSTFHGLNIFDISRNNFTGVLPAKVFESLGAMNNVNASQLPQYMHSTYFTAGDGRFFSFDFYYSMRMSNKATMTWYQKILDSLIAIDLSNNGFEGEVSESIGNIKNLYLLNLSSNALSGPIPSSLSNLTRLEVLDLSHNKLSGEIPDQLGQLSFLAFFDVSHNHLMGQIPQGTQFDTFSCSWFEGNSGLCGSQLAEKCEKSLPLPSPPSTTNEEDEESSGILWVIVAIGYASGLVTGVIGGNAMSPRIQYWISRTWGGMKMTRKRKQPKGNNRRRLQLH